MNSNLKNLIKAGIFAIVGFVILWFVYRSNNAAYQAECLQKGIAAVDCNLLDKVISDVKSAHIGWILISLLIFIISNISRALRWHIMLEPMGYKPRFVNSLSSILVAYLSNLGFPRSGEFVRAGILSKYENYPVEKVMGTIILDRIADVLMLVVIIGLTAILSYEHFYTYLSTHANIPDISTLLSSKIVLALGTGLIGVLALGYFLKNNFIQSTFGKKVINLLKGFKEGIFSITKLQRPWQFVFHTIVIWMCYFLMTYVVFFAFDPTSHLGPIAGLVIFVFGTLGIVFPSPGGMGSYHFLVGEGLGLYGIESADAFSFANIIFFSVQLFCNVLLGLIALIVLPIYNSKSSA